MKNAYDYAFEYNHQDCIAIIAGYKYHEDRTKDERELLECPLKMFLVHDKLVRCNSPMKIIKEKLYNDKEKLYNDNDSNPKNQIFLKTVLEHILNHPKVLNYILTYELSLVLAARRNILEEEEINNKLQEVQLMLNEIFNSKVCEKKEKLLQMLLPDIKIKCEGFSDNDSDRKRWLLMGVAHSIGAKEGVINYCLQNELKEIFQYSQISSLINDFLYSTSVRSTHTPNHHVFLIADFVKLSPIGLYKFRQVKHFGENLRYNPFFTFISDLARYALYL